MQTLDIRPALEFASQRILILRNSRPAKDVDIAYTFNYICPSLKFLSLSIF